MQQDDFAVRADQTFGPRPLLVLCKERNVYVWLIWLSDLWANVDSWKCASISGRDVMTASAQLHSAGFQPGVYCAFPQKALKI